MRLAARANRGSHYQELLLQEPPPTTASCRRASCCGRASGLRATAARAIAIRALRAPRRPTREVARAPPDRGLNHRRAARTGDREISDPTGRMPTRGTPPPIEPPPPRSGVERMRPAHAERSRGTPRPPVHPARRVSRARPRGSPLRAPAPRNPRTGRALVPPRRGRVHRARRRSLHEFGRWWGGFLRSAL